MGGVGNWDKLNYKQEISCVKDTALLAYIIDNFSLFNDKYLQIMLDIQNQGIVGTPAIPVNIYLY